MKAIYNGIEISHITKYGKKGGLAQWPNPDQKTLDRLVKKNKVVRVENGRLWLNDKD